MIRIVLVDDHPVVRAGLRALIEGQEDLSVVAEADGLPGAVAVVVGERPDVVLMDLNLGADEPGGAEVTAALGIDTSVAPHVVTGSGGHHFYFRKPADAPKPRKPEASGEYSFRRARRYA